MNIDKFYKLRKLCPFCSETLKQTSYDKEAELYCCGYGDDHHYSLYAFAENNFNYKVSAEVFISRIPQMHILMTNKKIRIELFEHPLERNFKFIPINLILKYNDPNELYTYIQKLLLLQ